MIEVKYKKKIFFVEKNFSDIYEKNFGVLKDKILYLSIYEVMYLIKLKKIKNLSTGDIKKKSFFDEKIFLVYADLKKKNYNVRTAFKFGFDFRVYNKGIKNKDFEHSLWFIKIIDESYKQKIFQFSKDLRVSNTAKKKMIYAVVDNELSITYYECGFFRFL